MTWRDLPPLIKCGNNFFGCLNFFFILIFKIFTAFAFILTVLFLVRAGYIYIARGDKPEEIKKAQSSIKYALIGFIVAFLSFAFVSFLEKIIANVSPETVIKKDYLLLILSKLNKLNILHISFAESIPITPPPEKISCGGVSLPSIFSGTTNLSSDIWKTCLIHYATRILSLLYFLSLSFAVIFLVWAGILYITKPEKSGEIHKKIIYGIVGIIITILSFTIVRILELLFTRPGL